MSEVFSCLRQSSVCDTNPTPPLPPDHFALAKSTSNGDYSYDFGHGGQELGGGGRDFWPQRPWSTIWGSW